LQQREPLIFFFTNRCGGTNLEQTAIERLAREYVIGDIHGELAPISVGHGTPQLADRVSLSLHEN